MGVGTIDASQRPGIEGSAQWSLRRDSGTDQRRSQNKKARHCWRASKFRRIGGRTPTVPESCPFSLTYVKWPCNMIQNRRQQATDFVQSPVIRGAGLRHSERAELV